MTATAITKDDDTVVGIELLRVEPEDQDALLRKMRDASRTLARQPGFVSASLHRGLDGGVVVNWSRSADEEALRGARRSPEFEHMAAGYADLVTGGDTNAYAVADVISLEGGRKAAEEIEIREGYDKVILIDVVLTTPEQQPQALAFNVANGRAFSERPGYLATAVLRGLDGTRNGTYAHWESVDAFLDAVKNISGGRLPALASVSSLEDLNAVLAEAGRGMGSVPEYHAYEVYEVILP